jgi:hypothetical protein
VGYGRVISDLGIGKGIFYGLVHGTVLTFAWRSWGKSIISSHRTPHQDFECKFFQV